MLLAITPHGLCGKKTDSKWNITFTHPFAEAHLSRKFAITV